MCGGLRGGGKIFCMLSCIEKGVRGYNHFSCKIFSRDHEGRDQSQSYFLATAHTKTDQNPEFLVNTRKTQTAFQYLNGLNYAKLMCGLCSNVNFN